MVEDFDERGGGGGGKKRSWLDAAIAGANTEKGVLLDMPEEDSESASVDRSKVSSSSKLPKKDPTRDFFDKEGEMHEKSLQELAKFRAQEAYDLCVRSTSSVTSCCALILEETDKQSLVAASTRKVLC